MVKFVIRRYKERHGYSHDAQIFPEGYSDEKLLTAIAEEALILAFKSHFRFLIRTKVPDTAQALASFLTEGALVRKLKAITGTDPSTEDIVLELDAQQKLENVKKKRDLLKPLKRGRAFDGISLDLNEPGAITFDYVWGALVKLYVNRKFEEVPIKPFLRGWRTVKRLAYYYLTSNYERDGNGNVEMLVRRVKYRLEKDRIRVTIKRICYRRVKAKKS